MARKLKPDELTNLYVSQFIYVHDHPPKNKKEWQIAFSEPDPDE